MIDQDEGLTVLGVNDGSLTVARRGVRKRSMSSSFARQTVWIGMIRCRYRVLDLPEVLISRQIFLSNSMGSAKRGISFSSPSPSFLLNLYWIKVMPDASVSRARNSNLLPSVSFSLSLYLRQDPFHPLQNTSQSEIKEESKLVDQLSDVEIVVIVLIVIIIVAVTIERRRSIFKDLLSKLVEKVVALSDALLLAVTIM